MDFTTVHEEGPNYGRSPYDVTFRRNMQGLNVFEKGIGYLWACLSLYTGECAYLCLYAAALVYICLRGSRREKEIFIPSSVFLILTVYNPVAPVILDKFFDVNNEYYRFFWLLPVIFLVPYLFAKLILSAAKGTDRVTISLLILCICLVSGKYVYSDGLKLATNIYKMPDELIKISEVIHDDSDAEYPKAFLEYEYNMQMRQYDPKILLTIDREDYLYAAGNTYTDEMLNDEMHPQYRLLAALVKMQPVEEEAFLDALEATKTEYVVLNRNNPRTSFLLIAGLKKVQETENHIVFKYSIKEPYDFELVDYSVVY